MEQKVWSELIMSASTYQVTNFFHSHIQTKSIVILAINKIEPSDW